MSHYTKKIVLVSATLGVVYYFVRRRRLQGRLPAYDLWQRLMTGRHGYWYALELIRRAQERYDGLMANRRQYRNAALRSHYEGNILPGIAIYQTLKAEGWSMRSIQEELSVLFSAQLRPQTIALRALSHLPNPFGAFRGIVRQQMKFYYPETGWEIRWDEDSSQRMAFNISRCFYLDVLSAYGVPELTPMFCETDDRLAESFPSQIRWRRKGTLGRGDSLCDFCYERNGLPDREA